MPAISCGKRLLAHCEESIASKVEDLFLHEVAMEDVMFLVAEDLHKNFGGIHALDGLDVRVKKGQIHGIIGPNGAGKTTFLNVVSGLLPLDRGKLIVDSIAINGLRPHAIASRGISRTFQGGKLVGGMTVVENVMSGMYTRTKTDILGTFFHIPFTASLQQKQISKKSHEILDFVGLASSANRWANDLVWVERQLVQIARALVSEPKILLLDEPTAGMGSKESRQMEQIIKRTRDEHDITVVLVSHDLRLVTHISDWITVVSFGKRVMEGTPKEVKQDARVAEIYLGK